MKYTLLFLLLCPFLSTQAQITLNETYANAGLAGGSNSWQTLEVVHLELDGDKFVFRDNENKTLKFYNLDHTLWKSISYSGAIDVDPVYNSANILYISQHLFDLDDEIEFMYVDVGSNVGVTQVVNEDGTFLFTANDQAPLLKGSVPQNQQPIYNTSEGTFMILSGAIGSDGNAYVYKLPGILSVGIEAGFVAEMNDGSSLLVYPNPTVDEVRIDYALPQGVSSGIITIYDTYGNEVKRLNIDRSTNHVNVSIREFASGTYLCNVQTILGIGATNRFVTIGE